MSKLTGIFDEFTNLDKITPDELERWVKTKLDISIENFLGNRLLYPNTIPSTEAEMEVDLAILTEAIRRNSQKFYDPNVKKINIPEEFLNRFLPKEKLVAAFINGLNLKGISSIFIDDKLVGSVVSLVLNKLPEVEIIVNNQKYKFKIGSIVSLPLAGARKIVINSAQSFLASGGELGIYFDLRRKNVNS